jgi:hypothetical protein
MLSLPLLPPAHALSPARGGATGIADALLTAIFGVRVVCPGR